MSQQEASRLIATIRAMGIELCADPAQAHILWRPIDALPQKAYTALVEQRAAVLALLCAQDPAVRWRADALQEQLPVLGPIPSLQARVFTQRAGSERTCGSCGDPLGRGQQYVCLPCQHAHWLAMMKSDGHRTAVDGGESSRPTEA
jgi:hypothetical protein